MYACTLCFLTKQIQIQAIACFAAQKKINYSLRMRALKHPNAVYGTTIEKMND